MVKKIFTLLILFIPLLILFPGFSNFIFPQNSDFSDLTISHLPNLIYLKKCISTWGEIPLWSNMILSGYPFAADPLSGIWYPFTWLLAFLPQPFGYNAVILLHLLIGGTGVFLLLREEGKGYWGAIIGAVAFQLMPKILSHYAAGHISLVFAVSFTPWVLLAEKKRRSSCGRLWKIAPGILLGWIALADIRWIPYVGIAWMAIFIDEMISLWRKRVVSKEKRGLLNLPLFLQESAGMMLQFFTAVGISAPALLPLIQYSSMTARASMEIADRLAFSLSPVRLINLIFPDIGGYAEWIVYPGIFCFLSLIAVVADRKSRHANRIWIVLLFISFFIALGSHNPFMSLLTRIPGFDYLRVPPRALFLGGLSFSILAGAYAEKITTSAEKQRTPIFLLLIITVFSMGIFLGYWFIYDGIQIELLWGGGFALLFLGMHLLFRVTQLHSSISRGLLIFSLVILDIGTVSVAGFQSRGKETVYKEDIEEVIWLEKYSSEPFRIYSPSYSISQLSAAVYDLELADGIDPLQLQRYVEFMSDAMGIEVNEYSVTLPPFRTGNPDIDNIGATPKADLLGLLNIRYVVSSFPIESEGLGLAASIGESLIYENLWARPRAWIQQTDDVLHSSFQPLSIGEWRPNHISLNAEGPGVVVLSEIDYVGWEVFVDGEKTEVIRIAGLLRAVEIEAGIHEIEFSFRPVVIYTGAAAALLTWTLIFFVFLFQRKKDRER